MDMTHDGLRGHGWGDLEIMKLIMLFWVGKYIYIHVLFINCA